MPYYDYFNIYIFIYQCITSNLEISFVLKICNRCEIDLLGLELEFDSVYFCISFRKKRTLCNDKFTDYTSLLFKTP